MTRDLPGCRQVETEFNQENDQLAQRADERHRAPTGRPQRSRQIRHARQWQQLAAKLDAVHGGHVFDELMFQKRE